MDDVTRTTSKGGVLVKNPVSAPGPPPPLKNPGSAPGYYSNKDVGPTHIIAKDTLQDDLI